MRKITHKELIAVAVALIVVAAFFGISLGLNGVFTANNATEVAQTNMANIDTAFSSSVNDLEIQDIVVGSGAEAVPGKILVVHYSGAFSDGRVFDSSYQRNVPFQFPLGAGQVIAGWERGFNGMKVGGKRRLVIPGHLAYGAEGRPGIIPSNATLIFEVELLEVR